MSAADLSLPAEVGDRGSGRQSRRSSAWKFIGQRVAISLVVLLAVSIVVFVATQALPSDPAQAILGRDATPERVAALREELNLNGSLVSQYVNWLSGVFQGDLGMSLARRQPVSDVLWGRFANSLILLGVVSLIAIPLSIALGAWAAIRRDGIVDKAGVGAALFLSAVPEFVIGILLTLMFATGVFRLVPATAILQEGQSPLMKPVILILPVATLTLAVVPYLYRLSRASMIDALDSDYVQMARLKGMPDSLIVRRHALPNAVVPVVQATAIVMSYLLSGVLVIEFLFRYPGLGTMLSDAIATRDLPVIQGVILVYAAAIVLLNLLADIVTVAVSPRLHS